VLPSYIEALSPNPSNREALPDQRIAQNPLMDNLMPSSTHLSPLLRTLSGESYIFTAGQQCITFAPNEPDLGVSFLHDGENEPFRNIDVTQTDHTEEMLSLQSPRSFTSMIDYDLDFSFLTEPFSDNTKPLTSKSRASDMPDFVDRLSRPGFNPKLLSPVPNSVITSPLTISMDLDIPAILSDGYETSSRLNLEPMCLSNEVIFYGTSPESIIPSVQMMKELFHRLQDDSFRKQHISSRGVFKWELHREIRSEVLLSEIDEIAIWAYQNAAKTVQQQKAARQSSCVDIQPFSNKRGENYKQTSQYQDQSASNEGNSTKLDGTLLSYCNIDTNCTTGGSLRVQLRRSLKEQSGRDRDDSQIIVAIYAIPKIRNHAKVGIHINIPTTPRSSQGLPIYTTIRAFNVVPNNSEIIECVRMNDLDGVRRLIVEKKASPRDVDAGGLSLLSVCLRSFQDFFWLS
jgi:hypothetical protein